MVTETDAIGIEPIPVETNGTGAPKRTGRGGARPGAGRKPKLGPDGQRINPPRPPSSRSRTSTRKPASPRPRGPRSLKPEIEAFLTLVNSAVIMTPLGTRPVEAITNPAIEPTKIGDELDAAEIGALAGALDTQCQRSPRFRKYVEKMLTAGSGGQLVSVLGIIVARRASRHGLAPSHIDPLLGMMLAGGGMEALGNMPPPAAATTPSDTGELPPDRAETVDFDNIGTFAEP